MTSRALPFHHGVDVAPHRWERVEFPSDTAHSALTHFVLTWRFEPPNRMLVYLLLDDFTLAPVGLFDSSATIMGIWHVLRVPFVRSNIEALIDRAYILYPTNP